MNTPQKPGRPTKFTPEVQSTIIAAVEAGLPFSLAAQGAGVSASTLHSWRHQYPEFSDAIKKAEARSALTLIEIVRSAAPKSWQAACWMLERRWPECFGRPETRVLQPQPKEEESAADIEARREAKYEEIFGLAPGHIAARRAAEAKAKAAQSNPPAESQAA